MRHLFHHVIQSVFSFLSCGFYYTKQTVLYHQIQGSEDSSRGSDYLPNAVMLIVYTSHPVLTLLEASTVLNRNTQHYFIPVCLYRDMSVCKTPFLTEKVQYPEKVDLALVLLSFLEVSLLSRIFKICMFKISKLRIQS